MARDLGINESIFPDVTAADTPEWAAIADSAARLVATAQALTEDVLHEASALPGWTRAHVLTHVAQAADSRAPHGARPKISTVAR